MMLHRCGSVATRRRGFADAAAPLDASVGRAAGIHKIKASLRRPTPKFLAVRRPTRRGADDSHSTSAVLRQRKLTGLTSTQAPCPFAESTAALIAAIDRRPSTAVGKFIASGFGGRPCLRASRASATSA